MTGFLQTTNQRTNAQPVETVHLEERERPARKISSNRPAEEQLFIDARMLFSSGIGRYLREIISRWPQDNSDAETYLCNSIEQIEWLEKIRPQASLKRTNAGIYSLREQTLALRFPAGAVYWVPHYNLPWICRARLIATVHDAAPLVLREVFHRRIQRLAARFYFGAARRTTHRVAAVSAFTAKELITHAGISADKIEVILNGVGESWFSTDEGVVRNPSRLLYVGNLKPHKNLFRLIQALDLLKAEGHQGLTLDIVGKIEGFRSGFEAGEIERLRSSSWITLHSAVDDSLLRSLYKQCGALVFPSLYEGFGLPLLEAMAGSCPVLASRASSLPEIGGPEMQHGGGVLYFDPYDVKDIATKIAAFLKITEAERISMGQSGHHHAKLYSWDHTARKTRELLLRR